MFSSGDLEKNQALFFLYCSLWAFYFYSVSVLSKFKTITKIFPPGIRVWLSCRDIISLWNLCCAEQRFRRYCAILEVSVTKPCFFPLGPPHSMISLRRWKTDTSHYTLTRMLLKKSAAQSNSDWNDTSFYPCGYRVSFSPEKAPGDSPEVVLRLIHYDSFGADSQNQLTHHWSFLSAHTVEHNSIFG